MENQEGKDTGNKLPFPSIGEDRLVIREDIKEALRSGAPVVALESALITHLFEYPMNRDTALELESIVI